MKKATIYLAVVGIAVCFIVAPVVKPTLTWGATIDPPTPTTGEMFGLAIEYLYDSDNGYHSAVILEKSSAGIYELETYQQTYPLNPQMSGPHIFDGFDDVAVGDFDGDGHDDVVISDYLYSNSIVPTPSLTGRIWVWRGPAYTSYFTIDGWVTDAYFGFSMDAGDFDGDGYDDLIISAPGMSSMAGNGEVYIYWGSDDYDDDTSMDGWENALFNPMTIQPDVLSGFDDIGWCVRNVGDLDDDRDDEEETPYYDDFIITNTNDQPYITTYDIGVFYGNTRNSISTTPDIHIPAWVHYFGADVDSGDINGDGYSDIITGTMVDIRLEGKRTGVGTFVVIYPGSSNGISLNDCYYHAAEDAWFGGLFENYPPYDIACIGDEDNDGCDEILMSRPHYFPNYYGIVYCWNGISDLNYLGYSAWNQTGSQTDQLFGYYRECAGKAICGIPDTIRDMRDEALIGSPFYDKDENTIDSGKVDHYINS